MLTMCLTLAIIAIIFEVKLVRTVPVLGRILSRSRGASLMFSLILSVLLGGFFGAAGLIVFVAAMLSTIAVQPYYFILRRFNRDPFHFSTGRRTASAT